MFEKSGSDVPAPLPKCDITGTLAPEVRPFDTGPAETIIAPSDQRAIDQQPESFISDTEAPTISRVQYAVEVLQGEPIYPEVRARINDVGSLLDEHNAELQGYVGSNYPQLQSDVNERVSDFYANEGRYPGSWEEVAMQADVLSETADDVVQLRATELATQIRSLAVELVDLKREAQPHLDAEFRRTIACLDTAVDWDKVLAYYDHPERIQSLLDTFAIFEPEDYTHPWSTVEDAVNDIAALRAFGAQALEQGWVASENPQPLEETGDNAPGLIHEITDWLQETNDIMQYFAQERREHLQAAIKGQPFHYLVRACNVLGLNGVEENNYAPPSLASALRRYAHNRMASFDTAETAWLDEYHRNNKVDEPEIRNAYLLTMAFGYGNVKEWFSEHLDRHQAVTRGGIHTIEIIEGLGPVTHVDSDGTVWHKQGNYDSKTHTVSLYLDARTIYGNINACRQYGNERRAENVRSAYLDEFLYALHHEGAHHDHAWEWTLSQLRTWDRLARAHPIDMDEYVTKVRTGELAGQNVRREDVACSLGRLMVHPEVLTNKSPARADKLNEWYYGTAPDDHAG